LISKSFQFSFEILLSPEKRDERSKEAINEVKGFVFKVCPWRKCL
jgi:hypothetical protein